VALFSFLVLFQVLKVRIGGIHGRRLRTVIGKVSVASTVMGLAVWLSSKAIAALLGPGAVARLLDLAITIPMGVAVLYYTCRALRVEELEMATRALGGPILRRFSSLNAKIGG